MKLQQLTDHTYYLPGVNNIGIITTSDGGAIAIDAGINKEAARAIRKELDEIGHTLRAIVSTHHHADHIGGNAYLLRVFPAAAVYASPLEAALIANPVLESVYLNMGGRPIDALRDRWIMAEAAPVHHTFDGVDGMADVAGVVLEVVPLPGHSIAQVGVAYEGVCFAADSFFSSMVLHKYGVPYAHDVAAQLASLERLAGRDDAWCVPGHGVAVARNELADTLGENRAAIKQASALVAAALPGTLADVTAGVVHALRQQSDNATPPPMGIPQYAIFASAVSAHLSFLEQQGHAQATLDEKRGVVFRPISDNSDNTV